MVQVVDLGGDVRIFRGNTLGGGHQFWAHGAGEGHQHLKIHCFLNGMDGVPALFVQSLSRPGGIVEAQDEGGELVAAGDPILAEQCVEDYLTFDTGGRDGEYFALRVRGESMLGAGILPDDLVVVPQQPAANNGEIVVALFDDEATVKTLSRKNGRTWLLPANPDYQPIDGPQAQILGKVAAVIRRY